MAALGSEEVRTSSTKQRKYTELRHQTALLLTIWCVADSLRQRQLHERCSELERRAVREICVVLDQLLHVFQWGVYWELDFHR